MKRAVCFLTLFLSIAFVSTAQNNKVQKASEPSWATIHTINYAATHLDRDSEDGYIDLDFERQVSLEHGAEFRRTIIKVLSEAGVQNSSEISIDFDPTYQQLIFHSINIIRGTKSLDKLQLSKFKVIQQEKELSMHLYDGSLTALMVLEDVRKGDIIEYSYTIKGFNPTFGNKRAGSFDLQFSVPLYNSYYKMIGPQNRI